MVNETILAIIIAFAISAALCPVIIPFLHRLKFGQQVRDDGPQSHLVKAGTPTMGGVIFLAGGLLSTLLFFRGDVQWTLFAVVITIGFGLIGFVDDFIKVHMHRSLGLKAYQKIIGQLGLAIVVALVSNLIVTPIYAHMTYQAVAAMILPILLPFNVAKMAIHAVITFLIYKPISNLLSKQQ